MRRGVWHMVRPLGRLWGFAATTGIQDSNSEDMTWIWFKTCKSCGCSVCLLLGEHSCVSYFNVKTTWFNRFDSSPTLTALTLDWSCLQHGSTKHPTSSCFAPDATSKPDPDRWPLGGWIPKSNLRIPESTIVSALYQSLYSHYILWMEEILHQLIDGLSHYIICIYIYHHISYLIPYIYTIISYIIYHHIIYHYTPDITIISYIYLIYHIIYHIIPYILLYHITMISYIYIIISSYHYHISYHLIYIYHHSITMTISYICIYYILYHHYIIICPIIYHMYSTCVSRGLQGRSDWCHAGEGGDPLRSSRFCRLLVEPPKMDQRGMVPPILYGYTEDILFMRCFEIL